MNLQDIEVGKWYWCKPWSSLPDVKAAQIVAKCDDGEIIISFGDYINEHRKLPVHHVTAPATAYNELKWWQKIFK